MQLDIKALGVELAAVVKSQMAPMQARIVAMEKEITDLRQKLAEVPAPKDGTSGADGKDGRDGKDCDMDAVKTMVEEMVKAIPPAKDGKDGVDGKDGSSVTLADVQPLIDGAVKAIRDESRAAIDTAIKAIPEPKNGADGKDGQQGEKGLDGKDGAGIADLMIDRAGELVATFTDGRMKNLGPVIGKDGCNGKDGADFSDVTMDWDGERTLIIRGAGGEIRKTLPIPLDRGYWRDGMACEKGDIVTHDGSAWVALADNKSKPSHDAKTEWRMMVRKGRDGESIVKTVSSDPPKPIKLGKPDSDDDKK